MVGYAYAYAYAYANVYMCECVCGGANGMCQPRCTVTVSYRLGREGGPGGAIKKSNCGLNKREWVERRMEDNY